MWNDFSLIRDWKWYHFVGKVGIFVSGIITFVGDELLRLDQTKREYLDGYSLDIGPGENSGSVKLDK